MRHPEKLDLLETMVRETFSYSEVLNLSFSNGVEVSADEPGFDWGQLREAYKLMLSLPIPEIRAFMGVIESLLKRPGRPMRRKEDI